jgi:low affinity Fe/Cu permease
MLAFFTVLLWMVLGPVAHWSDAWQLAISTVSSIVTFLMVFVIQNTQNRDTAALQVKIDELIRAIDQAQNLVLDLEELDDEQLEVIRSRYRRLAQDARRIRGSAEVPPPGG